MMKSRAPAGCPESSSVFRRAARSSSSSDGITVRRWVECSVLPHSSRRQFEGTSSTHANPSTAGWHEGEHDLRPWTVGAGSLATDPRRARRTTRVCASRGKQVR